MSTKPTLAPLPGEGAHDRLADAARPAGDENGPAGKARIGGKQAVGHGLRSSKIGLAGVAGVESLWSPAQP